MKKTLIFLTIISISFGANAKYNLKMPKKICEDIAYNATTVVTKLLQLKDDENEEKAKVWVDSLAKNAVIYKAYCKD